MAKKQKWGKTAAIVAAAIGGVAALGIWGVSTVASRLSNVARPGIETVEVTGGTIESTVTGTGTLEYQDAQDVTVPPGLDIESVLMGQGRQVQAGDLLATVSRAAAETRMSEIYEQIAGVDQKMLDVPQESQLVEIKAPVAGTVASVNAGSGASVLDTLASTGSLAVVSADGKMAVDVKANKDASALPGETILVEAANGERISATVRDVTETGFTAELTNASIGAQEVVTVLTPRGERIGEGTTHLLDAANVVGPAGTVESVRVTAGQKVKAGDVMLTVRTSGKPAEYVTLEQQRWALAREYDQLARIAGSGGITAPLSGTIVSCSVSAGQNTSALDGASGSSGEAGGLQLPFSASDAVSLFGSGMSAQSCSQHTDAMLSVSADEHDDEPAAEPPADTPVPTQPGVSSSDEPAPTHDLPPIPTPAPRPIPRVEVPLVPPIAGFPLQTVVGVFPVYMGTVEWSPADVQAQHETVYTAAVVLRAEEGFFFAEDCTATVLNGTPEDIHSDGETLSFTVTYPETPAQLVLPDIDWEAIQDFLNGAGSLDMDGLRDLLASGLLPTDGLGFDLSSLTSQVDPSSLYGQLDPSVLAGAMSGASVDPSVFAGQSSLGDVADALGSVSAAEPVAYRIAPDDGMQLVIRINQMDILSVQPGMRCMVAVDAIPDTEFEGTVEEVSQIVSGDGDYTASITVPKDDRMRSGMTASATIVTQETADVLTLPVSALQEDGNRVFVYTGYDDASREFTGEADVETGVSNGSDVEILSGLEPGQIVYYAAEDPMREMMRMMGSGVSDDQGDAAQSTYVPPDQTIATP